jgi:hypothetical protein
MPVSCRSSAPFRASLIDQSLPRTCNRRGTEWVVYAKPPFADPQQVLDYVDRYTHRVAISNNRLLDIEEGHVSFRYKDYRADSAGAQKTMILSATRSRKSVRGSCASVVRIGGSGPPWRRAAA